MNQAETRSELSLVRAVRAGDPGAVQRFLDAFSATMWSVVVRLEGEGAAGETAFLEVIEGLKADGYARLAAFDGRARLSTYLAIVARDVLADRLARSFVEAPHRAWARFERFFGTDLRRRVAQRFPRNTGISGHEDAYQEVCLKLIEDDYRRIRAYDGHGSFTGYVLTVVERILIDLLRREAPRRRLPAAIARLSPLDQQVYTAIVWDKHSADPDRLAMALRGRLECDPDAAEIRMAVERVAKLAPLAPAAAAAELVSLDTSGEDGEALAVADSGVTPEEHLLEQEEEQTRSGLLAAVKAAADKLPADERLYLQIVFSATEPLPAREISKLMHLPVEDVYRLKQRSQRWLTEIAGRLEKN
jgi:RNA polymerase primary sigma factor